MAWRFLMLQMVRRTNEFAPRLYQGETCKKLIAVIAVNLTRMFSHPEKAGEYALKISIYVPVGSTPSSMRLFHN